MKDDLMIYLTMVLMGMFITIILQLLAILYFSLDAEEECNYWEKKCIERQIDAVIQ